MVVFIRKVWSLTHFQEHKLCPNVIFFEKIQKYPDKTYLALAALKVASDIIVSVKPHDWASSNS